MSPRAFGYERPGEGATNDWITPMWIADAFKRVPFPLRDSPEPYFDLDPCASETQPWPTAKHMHKKSAGDGLALMWAGRVWCNPPYGPHARAWIDKMASHRNGIALLFARTETYTWQRIIFPTASAILFIEGRLAFSRPDGSLAGSATAPSALVAWGSDCAKALNVVPIIGARVLLPPYAKGGETV